MDRTPAMKTLVAKNRALQLANQHLEVQLLMSKRQCQENEEEMQLLKAQHEEDISRLKHAHEMETECLQTRLLCATACSSKADRAKVLAKMETECLRTCLLCATACSSKADRAKVLANPYRLPKTHTSAYDNAEASWWMQALVQVDAGNLVDFLKCISDINVSEGCDRQGWIKDSSLYLRWKNEPGADRQKQVYQSLRSRAMSEGCLEKRPNIVHLELRLTAMGLGRLDG